MIPHFTIFFEKFKYSPSPSLPTRVVHMRRENYHHKIASTKQKKSFFHQQFEYIS